ncbi:hypothetical protein [Spiroplasma endosymbiont of Notiophilus biguttatus]|uniref:hypothetical protein n=1 Tax=Spiroplasma endosymbiont of Notiophilus biguttatus TaxID=3066285 RepID=UPI00313CBECA
MKGRLKDMYSKVKRIKSIYKLIAEIKEEIKLTEGFEERKMYHVWVQEPLCNVVDITWYHEIDIKIQNIEKRLNNNINKTSLKEIKIELEKITKEIDQKNGWDIEEDSNSIDEINKIEMATLFRTIFW